MQKKHLVWMILFLILAGCISWVILRSAELPNKESNGFSRNILMAFTKPDFEREFGSHVVRISGATENTIFLSGRSPSWLLRTDYQMKKVDTSGFGITTGEDFQDANMHVDSPDLSMVIMGDPHLIKGNIDSINVSAIKLNSEMLTRAVRISRQTLFTRGIDSTQTHQVFRKISTEDGSVRDEKEIIHSNQFGGFDMDGFLKYDKVSSKLFYVQMFQNKIYCLDTFMNILYTANTIDTTSTNMVSIGLVEEGGTTKVMSKVPRIVVNQQLDVYNNRIFVVSGLRGDNETLSEFNKFYPVDIYDAKNGKYLGSIRFPKLKRKALLDFKVTKYYWIAMYDGGECVVFKVDKES